MPTHTGWSANIAGSLVIDPGTILKMSGSTIQLQVGGSQLIAEGTAGNPIVMTSIATALGLVPMSLGIGEGSELQVPLARVVIGGLTTSLLITLVLVPTVYTLFEEGFYFRRGKKADTIEA